MDRIAMAFARWEKQIAQRIADSLTTAAAVEETRRKLDMGFDEYVKFQELKSLAVAQEKLTLDEGMTIYNALGNVPATFNAQPIHVKVALTSLFQELISWKIKGCK